MKQLLITIAVVLLVGCGKSQKSAFKTKSKPAEPVSEVAIPETTTTKAPNISINKAVDSGNIEAVKQHIAAGTNLNKKDVSGLSLLHWAADYGHKEIAELLIGNGADVNAGRPLIDSEMKIYYGETPLDMALSEENQETVDLLRKHGAKTRDWLDAEKSIYIAARAGHIEAIKKHLADGADINAKDFKGWTPLDHAKEQPGTAEFLRTKGGISGGEDSIHVAAWVGNIDALKKHLVTGIDLNAKDENGWPLLSCAVNGGHKGIVELLISEGVNVNINNNGFENLYSAIAEGQKEIIRLLINAGVDVNCKDEGGMTPLHSAAQIASKEIVELLIKKGADLNAKSNEGRTPLDYADNKSAALLRKLGGKKGEESKAGETILEVAQTKPTINTEKALDFWLTVISGHAGDVKQAIDEGADVNAKVGGGKTPLHGAARKGFEEIAVILIDNGADVNAQDSTGKTPLYEAIKNHREIVELLLAKGADLNLKPKIGYPLLHDATRWGRAEIVELLISNGANVNERTLGAGFTPMDTTAFNKKQITSLLRKYGGKTLKELESAELGVSVDGSSRISIHDASGARGRKGNMEAIKQHLADGTDVDARDRENKTPLQHAAYWGHKEIAKYLITKGADVNAKDNYGNTTLNWAISGRKKESIELLIANGVDVNAKAKNGFTPLDSVSMYNLIKLANLLRKKGAKHGTIHGAAAGGDAEFVKQKIASGTDVNANDKGGRTPLYYAAYSGRTEIAKLLIAEGADVNSNISNGSSPLDFAIRNKQTLLATLLRKHGAKTHEELMEGVAPRLFITKAVRDGNIEVIKKHIAAGTNVDTTDDFYGKDTTSLMLAADFGEKEIAELLIASGANVNATSIGGRTPLDRALKPIARHNQTHKKIAALLRKHGGKTSAELKADGK